MLAGLELGQQLFDSPLYLREFLYERCTIHDRVITRYRPAGKKPRHLASQEWENRPEGILLWQLRALQKAVLDQIAPSEILLVELPRGGTSSREGQNRRLIETTGQ